MKATFYLVETSTTRVITEKEFKDLIISIQVSGIDPIECIEVAHGIRDRKLEIEVYLEMPSDKLLCYHLR